MAYRQAVSRTPQLRIDAVREIGDEVHATGCLQGRHHLRLAGIGVGEQEVLPNRLGQQDVFLEDIGDVAPQAVDVQFAHVFAVDQHATGCRRQQRRDEIGEGGLACARRSHDSDQFTHIQFEIDIAKRLLPVGVGEAGTFESYAAPNVIDRDTADAILFGRIVEEKEDAANRRDDVLQLDPPGAEISRGNGDTPEHTDKDREVARRHRAFYDGVRDKDGHVYARDAEGRTNDQRHNTDHEDGVAFPQEGLAASFRKAPVFLLAGAEALDRGDIAHGFLHGIGRGRASRALVLVGPP